MSQLSPEAPLLRSPGTNYAEQGRTSSWVQGGYFQGKGQVLTVREDTQTLDTDAAAEPGLDPSEGLQGLPNPAQRGPTRHPQ